MNDILSEIVERRKADIKKQGFSFGYNLPAARKRAVHPFLQKNGVILEVKRASPSKGDIAPLLDAAETAFSYAQSGAAAISCLTETNYFKGTLDDLQKVCAAVDRFEAETGQSAPAVLRKDFLLCEEEIDVAYLAGADAVLLIARILETEQIVRMAQKAAAYKMTSLVEVRTEADIEKLAAVAAAVEKKYIACGVNSRDLANFKIDLLTPCSMLTKIRTVLGADAHVIFESGIRTPQSAAFAGSLGFTGMLLGEAAAKNPQMRTALVEAFIKSEHTKNAIFWNELAVLRNQKRPLVKICGITNLADAIFATQCGADFLGFVMWEGSPRNVCSQQIIQMRQELESGLKNQHDKKNSVLPKFVAVIVNPADEQGKAAISLAKAGVIDAIQLHTIACAESFLQEPENRKLPHYAAVNVSCKEDTMLLEKLFEQGEPRVLVDAKAGGKNAVGGTGKRIENDLIEEVCKKNVLWLAGGINPDNVAEIAGCFSPELIDVSSGVESEPGIKSHSKIKKLFENL